jgi:hypothetical protein
MALCLCLSLYKLKGGGGALWWMRICYCVSLYVGEWSYSWFVYTTD